MNYCEDTIKPLLDELRKHPHTYESLIWTLVSNGYALPVAQRIVDVFVQHNGNDGSLLLPARQPCPEPLFSTPGLYDFAGREVSVAVSHLLPRIAVIDNLVSEQECERLIELGRAKLEPSLVFESGRTREHTARQSSTAAPDIASSPLVHEVTERLARFTQWPRNRCEQLQLTHYASGQEYRAHHDFFTTKGPGGIPRHVLDWGNRIATVVLYLNRPKRGGSTYFANLGLEVFPRPGSILFFSYPNADSSSMSLHAGTPVLEGEKWIATLWLREGKTRVDSTQARSSS